MNNKWFTSAAVVGSGFEHLSDFAVEFSDISSEKLREIDLLFVKDKVDFFSKFRFSGFTVISETEIPLEKQEKHLLLSTGETFLSRIGHDIVNLMIPFEHFEYLEDGIIIERVKQGVRFGKQINTIGHLIQNTKAIQATFYDFDDFILTIQTLCRKSGINVKINNTGNHRIDSIPDMTIMNPVIDEILANWKMHGKDKFDVDIINKKELVFRNSFDGSFKFKRAKAELRCPFMKKVNSPGAGLGLFIVSLSSAAGGFDWDISVKDNCFSLSLVF